jgi:hypothetical protein
MLSSLSLPEDLITVDHPIWRIRKVVWCSPIWIATGCTHGRAGRACRRETLLKATVLMALYSIRPERRFCERLNYDLLFKWFL